MLSPSEVLIIALQFTFIFLGQCKKNDHVEILSKSKDFKQKLNAAKLLAENNFDHGKDIWASTDTECYTQIKMLRSANASKETWTQQSKNYIIFFINSNTLISIILFIQ